MNYPSTYPSAWHRLVAWLLLLFLPAYALGSYSYTVTPKTEPADNVIKAVVVEVNTYEANRALSPKSGSDTPTDTRQLLLPIDLPGESLSSVGILWARHSDHKITPHPLWRGGKTSLQLFYCVLLI